MIVPPQAVMLTAHVGDSSRCYQYQIMPETAIDENPHRSMCAQGKRREKEKEKIIYRKTNTLIRHVIA